MEPAFFYYDDPPDTRASVMISQRENLPPLFLIGPMGAGKTAIGRQLARRLGLPFFDTDQVIQERTGVDIPFIFEKEGEPGFRRREAAVIDELSKGAPAVIATGGGAVLTAANRERMASSGLVVFLETSVDWQLARTRRGSHRPLLANHDPRSKLAEIYAEREPLYRSCARITVSTDERRVATVAIAILVELVNAGLLEEAP